MPASETPSTDPPIAEVAPERRRDPASGPDLAEAVGEALAHPSIRHALERDGLDARAVLVEARPNLDERWARLNNAFQVESLESPIAESIWREFGTTLSTLVAALATVAGLAEALNASRTLVVASFSAGVAGVVLAVLLRVRALRRARAAESLALKSLQASERLSHERLLSELVLPELRAAINRLRSRFANHLGDVEPEGLGDLFDPEFEVTTEARDRLQEALAALRAGSLGIAGPRGAGKTTLIAAAVSGRLPLASARPLVGIMVPAPVRYEAREFVPHLFARLCIEILGPRLREEKLAQAREERRRALLWLMSVLLALVSILVIAYIVAIGTSGGLSRSAPFILTAAVSVAAAVVLGGVVPALRVRLGATRSGFETPLLAAARENLQKLRYLETSSQEWSAEVATKGAKFAGKQAFSHAEQALTLPELTAAYREFIELITDEHVLVIGIDELDKMASAEEAQRFLNDVKALFGQPRAYYLVSLSDDAMRAFEQRGLPVRDAFESVFDDFLRVQPLSYAESTALLRRRVTGMPSPFVALCHCLSGGLPRELIRAARTVVHHARHDDGLAPVAAKVIEAMLVGRQRAAEVVAGRFIAADGRQPVIGWLRDRPESLTDARGLLERTAVASVLGDIRTLASSGLSASALAELELLVVELAASWYHASTVLDLFGALSKDRMDHLADSGCFDLLARATLDLAVAPEVAWTTTSAVRTRVGLESYGYERVFGTSPAPVSRT